MRGRIAWAALLAGAAVMATVHGSQTALMAKVFGWWLLAAFALLCAVPVADVLLGRLRHWSVRQWSKDVRNDAETARTIERWRNELL